MAHIGQEILKRFKPAVTNFNPSTAIPLPSTISSIGATLFHQVICPIFRCSVLSMLRVDAPTTDATSNLREILSKYLTFFSAVAEAQPSRSIIQMRELFGDYKFSEPSSDKTKGIWHECILMQAVCYVQ